MTVLAVMLVGASCIGTTYGDETTITLAELPVTSPANSRYSANRAPLQPAPLIRLPLGSVNADGWLKHQLDLMADGQVGRLEELSDFLTEDSGWLGGEERGWEEAAYWFRGFYDLSVLTGDERLQNSASKWLETVIHSQTDEGYYGSSYNRLVEGKDGQRIVDLWPHMVMNEALISRYEATGDERVIPMLTRFFAFCQELPEDQFLPQISWDYYESYKEHFGDWKPRIQIKRAGEFVPQLIWLYNQTGEEWMLKLAVKVYHKTQPAQNQWLDNHTVHFSQRFRYPAQMYPITGDSRYLRKTEHFYDTFYAAWGQMPRGAHAADERIRVGRIDPRQAIETCSLSELNLSHYILSRITGNTKYADRVEDITFNHLPASHRPDHRSIRYLTASNMPTSLFRMDFHNRGLHPVFCPDAHRCCQHNTAMGWPRFTRNLWQATIDGGVAAWLYAPNTVTAKVGQAGIPVKIRTRTGYPFREGIALSVALQNPTLFPLYLRIPGWCQSAKIRVGDDETIIEGQPGKIVKINRNWQDGDEVSIRFAMDITTTQWPRTGAVTIDRGPLSFSVRIKQDWERKSGIKHPEQWPRWVAHAASAWNYGLAINPEDPSEAVTITETDSIASQPWEESAAPIILNVPAKRIPGWGTKVDNTVDAVREGPIRSPEPLETIEMIPMGCAHLRMSVLPVVSERADAREWQDVPDPGEFMLERLTH
jgi:DUF1680 family protein